MLLALQKQTEETEEFTESRADELFSIHIGKTPPRKEPEWFSFNRASNVIWMSIKDMSNGNVYLIDSSEYLTPEAVEKHNVKKCSPGSILLSFKLTVGRVGIAASEMVTNEAIACFSSDDSRKLAYLYPLLKSYDYASLGSTSSIAVAVNSRMIKAMKIKMPSSTALDRYYAQAEPIYDLLLDNAKETAALVGLRDILLPRLMSGEIDVSEVEVPTQLNNHFLLQLYKLEFSCIIQYPFPKQTLPNRSMLQPCDLGEKMDETLANQIANKMSVFLNSAQMKALQNVLAETFKLTSSNAIHDDRNILDLFLQAKKVEGCSPQTIKYYQSVIQKISDQIQKPFPQITTEDLRSYLDSYQERKSPSRVTLDNIRRIMSTFFSWLEDEEYIVKSPVRRIKRVKTISVIKETFTDEQIEIIRDGCPTLRDRAIIELLSSTGIRIGELVRLNKTDINFLERECIVLGKGNKERRAYFDAKTKIYLERYLKSRNDNNPALFVGFNTSRKRLTIGAIEDRLRSIGKRLGVNKVYPHKFRRTLATNAIDRGMPIEQVQKLLGHSRIDTTMHYALVNESNVKASHRRYLT